MKRRLGLVRASAVLLGLAPVLAWGASAPIRLQDYRQLLQIASPHFSPDGQQLAFLTVVSDFAHDRYDASLRVMDTSGGKSRVLVDGMRALQMPRWSPDGHTLAFIAKAARDKSEPQIYTVAARRCNSARHRMALSSLPGARTDTASPTSPRTIRP